MRLFHWTSNLLCGSSTRQVISLVSVVVLAGIVVVACSWEWLQAGSPQPESNSTTIRNGGLLVGAAVALVFAIWRGQVSERQTDIAQQSLLNERYQKSAEMLGHSILTVRLGGIHALQRLAEEYPGQHHVQIIRLLCAFVCNPTEPGSRPDVQAAMDAIGSRNERTIMIEQYFEYRPSLAGAHINSLRLNNMNLAGIDFSSADLEGTRFNRANLDGAYLNQTNLIRTDFTLANLSDATFVEADMTDARAIRANCTNSNFYGAQMSEMRLMGARLDEANFDLANLSGAIFHARPLQTEGLTQQQIEYAIADAVNPPKFNGLLDAETGAPIEWKGLDESVT